MRTQTVGEFTPTHHALMMGWISKEVVEAVGEEEGERIIRKAVVTNGNQRGKRMAIRAEANGHHGSFANFISYGEFKVSRGGFKMEFLERSPDLRWRTSRCPWSDTWRENGLMQYRRFFCMEIDKAVAQRFNEDLVLEVNSTLSDGAEYCDMAGKEADFNLMKMAGVGWKKVVRPGRTAVMPWEYHVGHLYKTLAEVITEELGEQASDVMAAALEDFTGRYGEAATETVLSYQDTDLTPRPGTPHIGTWRHAMKMELLTDGVYQLGAGMVNSYIIDGDEGVTLVDTLVRGRKDAIAQNLQEIGRTLTDVRAILLTHSHMDHTGSAAAVKAASNATVYASEADTPAIQGVEKPPNPPTHWYYRPMYWPAVFFPDPPPVKVDHFVSEDAKEVLPGDLRAIDTPGHTPGHTSYILDRDDGLLLVGDAAVATKDGRVKRLAFNRSTPDIDGSLRHLAEFEFEIAAFSHSKPIRTQASAAFRSFADELSPPK